jgi:polyisoprenoid-binding protein YceI
MLPKLLLSTAISIMGLSTIATASCEAKYSVSKQLSNVSFTITKIFFKEQGGFRDYSGEICFDSKHPERSSVRFTVQTASIDTRNDMRDHELRSNDFFDVSKYPTMSFASTSISVSTPEEIQVSGDFTLHGITKTITVPVHLLGRRTLKGFGTFIGFETEFVIERTTFGVNGTQWSAGSLILSKDVNVHLAIGAVEEH